MRWAALALLLAAGPAWGQAAPASPWQPKGSAELILLDKMQAQPSTVDVKVGGSTSFGTLTVQVQSCVVRPPDMPADAAAFLVVTDTRSAASAFKGWILENTPAVSQFEDPIYDLRLAACK